MSPRIYHHSLHPQAPHAQRSVLVPISENRILQIKARCNARKVRHAEQTAHSHVASAAEQNYAGHTFGILPKTRQLLPPLVSVLSLHLKRSKSNCPEPPSAQRSTSLLHPVVDPRVLQHAYADKSKRGYQALYRCTLCVKFFRNIPSGRYTRFRDRANLVYCRGGKAHVTMCSVQERKVEFPNCPLIRSLVNVQETTVKSHTS